MTQEYNRIHTEIKETFEAKNRDYGNSFEKSLDAHGLIAAIVRIGDKYERACSLEHRKTHARAVVDESLADTFKDMANYCIMTAAWFEKNKPEV